MLAGLLTLLGNASPQAAGGLTADTLTAEQQLGQMLYMDPNLSLHRNQSCNSCHTIEPTDRSGMPRAAAFVDPNNVQDGSAVSIGSDSWKKIPDVSPKPSTSCRSTRATFTISSDGPGLGKLATSSVPSSRRRCSLGKGAS